MTELVHTSHINTDSCRVQIETALSGLLDPSLPTLQNAKSGVDLSKCPDRSVKSGAAWIPGHRCSGLQAPLGWWFQAFIYRGLWSANAHGNPPEERCENWHPCSHHRIEGHWSWLCSHQPLPARSRVSRPSSGPTDCWGITPLTMGGSHVYQWLLTQKHVFYYVVLLLERHGQSCCQLACRPETRTWFRETCVWWLPQRRLQVRKCPIHWLWAWAAHLSVVGWQVRQPPRHTLAYHWWDGAAGCSQQSICQSAQGRWPD